MEQLRPCFGDALEDNLKRLVAVAMIGFATKAIMETMLSTLQSSLQLFHAKVPGIISESPQTPAKRINEVRDILVVAEATARGLEAGLETREARAIENVGALESRSQYQCSTAIDKQIQSARSQLHAGLSAAETDLAIA